MLNWFFVASPAVATFDMLNINAVLWRLGKAKRLQIRYRTLFTDNWHSNVCSWNNVMENFMCFIHQFWVFLQLRKCGFYVPISLKNVDNEKNES